MQAYAIKLYNFLRFGEENNTIVFDCSPEEMSALSENKTTMDQVYDGLIKDPVAKIKEIKARNINEIIGICGMQNGDLNRSNGSGKSTIFEAICYALYDQIIRRNLMEKTNIAGLSVVTRFNGKIPDHVRESYVELFFEEREKLYRVKRGRHFSKNHKTSEPFLEFECLSDKESLSGHRTKDTKKSISDILFNDYEIFVNSIMFGQNDAGRFLTGTDKVRKEMIVNLLRMEEVISGCLQKTRDIKNDLEKEVTKTNNNIELLQNELSKKKTVEELNNTISQNKTKISKLNSDLNAIRQEISKLENNDDIKELKLIEEEGRKLKAEMTEKESVKKNQAVVWENILKESNNSQFEKRNKLNSLNNNITSQKAFIIEKEKSVGSFNIEENKDIISKATRAMGYKEQFETELNDIIQKKNKNSENIGSETGNINRCKKEIESLESQIQLNSDSNEFKCDKCKSKVTKQHIENEIQSYTKQKEESQLKFNSLDVENKNYDKSIEDLRSKLKKIEEWVLKSGNAKNATTVFEKDKELIDLKKKAVVELESDCVVLNKEVETLCAKINEANLNIKEIDGKFKESTKEAEKRFEELRNRYNLLKSNTEKLNAVLNEKRRAIESNEYEISQCNSDIGSIINEIENMKKLNEQLKTIQKESEEKIGRFNRLIKIEEILGLDGIQTRIVNKYLPLLNGYIKEFLNVLSDGEMNLSCSINDKSKIDISISGGTADSYEMLSGGEQTIVRLATNIGLALLSFSRCAIKPEMICMDELFASLDPSRTNGVFRLLTKLQDKFSRVVVISHRDIINELLPHIITIEKSGGIFGLSKVKSFV